VSFLDPGAVEQDADAVVIGEDARDEGRDRVWGGEVCGVDCCAATQGFDCLLCGLVGGVALGVWSVLDPRD